VLVAELVPPALRGVVVGQSTDVEVIKTFGEGTVLTDASLGGKGEVSYSDVAGVRMTMTAKHDAQSSEAWFVQDASKTLRLQHIELVTTNADTYSGSRPTSARRRARRGGPERIASSARAATACRTRRARRTALRRWGSSATRRTRTASRCGPWRTRWSRRKGAR